MRIIGGRFRGRPLAAPAGLGTRPITDRVKESIFNILGSRFGTLGTLPDVRVLDLFAGSGSFGIESLSRGARFCLFVERGRQALPTLRDNLRRLDLGKDEAVISTGNAWALAPSAVDRYGLVFVDPPYRDVEDTVRMLQRLDGLADVITDDALVVFRLDRDTGFPVDALSRMESIDDREFGSMRVYLLNKRPADSGVE